MCMEHFQLLSFYIVLELVQNNINIGKKGKSERENQENILSILSYAFGAQWFGSLRKLKLIQATLYTVSSIHTLGLGAASSLHSAVRGTEGL